MNKCGGGSCGGGLPRCGCSDNKPKTMMKQSCDCPEQPNKCKPSTSCTSSTGPCGKARPEATSPCSSKRQVSISCGCNECNKQMAKPVASAGASCFCSECNRSRSNDFAPRIKRSVSAGRSGSSCSDCNTIDVGRSTCSDCFQQRKYRCLTPPPQICSVCAPKDALRYSPFSSHRAVPMVVGGRAAPSRPFSAICGVGVSGCYVPDKFDTTNIQGAGSGAFPSRSSPSPSQSKCHCSFCKASSDNC